MISSKNMSKFSVIRYEFEGAIPVSKTSEFELLSNDLILTLKQFSSDASQNIYLYHCPMAFDNKGADWLQNKEGTENPYFGSKMFKCGTQEEILAKKHKE